jgi:allantoinase
LIDPLVEALYDRGQEQPQAHCWSRPPISETTAVLHLLELVRNYPVKLHIAHLTVPFAYDALNWYRALGVDVTAETCIQYLLLDESHLSTLRGGAKCNPPLRTRDMQEALWQRLFDGDISFVVSDHAPWPDSDKSAPNIFDNKSGLPGVELLLPLFFSEGVVARGLDLLKFVDLISAGAAKRYGLYPQKGSLLVGADADITVLDPDQKWVISGENCRSAATISPYEGMTVNGRVVQSFVRGSEVFDGKEVVGKAGYGRFVRSAA